MGARVGNSSVAGIVRPARNDARNSMIRADELAEIERSQIAGVDEVSGQLAPQECVRPRRTYVEPALPAIEAKRGNGALRNTAVGLRRLETEDRESRRGMHDQEERGREAQAGNSAGFPRTPLVVLTPRREPETPRADRCSDRPDSAAAK